MLEANVRLKFRITFENSVVSVSQRFPSGSTHTRIIACVPDRKLADCASAGAIWLVCTVVTNLKQVADPDESCEGVSKNDMGECRMDIVNSELGYLGYNSAESYGLTWKVWSCFGGCWRTLPAHPHHLRQMLLIPFRVVYFARESYRWALATADV